VSIYLLGIILTGIVLVWQAPKHDHRTTAIVAFFWPAVLTAYVYYFVKIYILRLPKGSQGIVATLEVSLFTVMGLVGLVLFQHELMADIPLQYALFFIATAIVVAMIY
jgi:hypothetical protein